MKTTAVISTLRSGAEPAVVLLLVWRRGRPMCVLPSQVCVIYKLVSAVWIYTGYLDFTYPHRYIHRCAAACTKNSLLVIHLISVLSKIVNTFKILAGAKAS